MYEHERDLVYGPALEEGWFLHQVARLCIPGLTPAFIRENNINSYAKVRRYKRAFELWGWDAPTTVQQAVHDLTEMLAAAEEDPTVKAEQALHEAALRAAAGEI